ncbi:hypothetical protein D9619_000396 [Psilocybe cf. subviscida]|uniref:Uncharacterized protein n=1 Tax=Psilocybe cf. subviscida TaxID=2480587 RepID=A0A8H5F470_9AGAR|nr:hypothetical protein D9619_000396 [Psilocybe cf. subviscida]
MTRARYHSQERRDAVLIDLVARPSPLQAVVADYKAPDVLRDIRDFKQSEQGGFAVLVGLK